MYGESEQAFVVSNVGLSGRDEKRVDGGMSSRVPPNSFNSF
jgi:hypothetical protein